jgi:acyl carrier protein
MDVRTVAQNVFKEFFDIHSIVGHETIVSLGGDSLDAVEILMAIEDDLNIKFDDPYIFQEKIGTMSIDELIDSLQQQFNIN